VDGTALRLESENAALRERLALTEEAAQASFRQLARRADELRESYAATVRALADAVEARDAYTGGHAQRVAAYGLEVARAAGLQLADKPEIEFGFILHDVGKVAIPDAILFKPGPLSGDEELLMQRHTVIGFEIVSPVRFLGEARAVVRSHHERWDGAGYPDGLAGKEIPLPARVFAVADALDALTTDRPYRPASSVADAREIVEGGKGTQFDPDAVEALALVSDERVAEIRAATL
jgi:HD-GYP domain-containing protein (c-di-GMP phosphodiesterase class II)